MRNLWLAAEYAGGPVDLRSGFGSVAPVAMPNKSRFNLSELQDTIRGLLDERAIRLGDGISKLEKFVHFWVMVTKSFVRNRCPVRASALSYTTMLALVPMLAVAMSITSIFLKTGGRDQIETFIQQFVEYVVPAALPNVNAPEVYLETSTNSNAPTKLNTTNNFASTQTEPTNLVANVAQTNAPAAPISDVRVVAAQKKAADHIHQFIQNTYSGTLGVTGVVFLLWTAIVMLTRVEETFNDIWGVPRGRNWLSRIVLYWATITLGPLLLVGALGLASGPYFQNTRELLTVLPFLESAVSRLLPVMVIALTFTLFYKLMPNTKVHFSAALVGGALAGTSWYVFNLISLHLATSAVNTSKVYGSLALVPLLMIGLYTVWVIVLFGAQVAYAFQNREAYLQEKLAENVNQRGREFVALRLVTCIGQRFQRSLPLATVPEMSRELGIPSRLVQQVLQTLLAARLVVEVSRGEPAYAPARPLEEINAHHVLMAMRATMGQELVTRDEPVRAEIYGEFARIQAAEKTAAASVTMFALVNRVQARLELAAPAVDNKPAKQVMAPAPEIIATAVIGQESATMNPAPLEPVLAPSIPALETPLPSAQTDPTQVPPASFGVVTEEAVARSNTAPTPPTAEAATSGQDSFPL